MNYIIVILNSKSVHDFCLHFFLDLIDINLLSMFYGLVGSRSVDIVLDWDPEFHRCHQCNHSECNHSGCCVTYILEVSMMRQHTEFCHVD